MNSRSSLHGRQTREQIESLLDFVLLYTSDCATRGARSVAEYQALFPDVADLVASEYERLTSGDPSSRSGEASASKPRIAHYVLERQLGGGGQGRVFLAMDAHMRRPVALKVLNHTDVTSSALQRFRREVGVIARLDHPGLCTVYDADLEAPQPYLAMRYVPGEDLSRKLAAARAGDERQTYLRPRGRPELAQLLRIFERAARALHAAHEAGVVHRDIKPANILVRDDEEPVIVDFGLARDDESDLAGMTQTNDLLGTPAYMAPELLEPGHASADRRVDAYSLGVTLYECLTLERPFHAEHRETIFRKILQGDCRSPRELNPVVNEDLRVVVATAMERDAERRYATALELAEDLRRVREYEPIQARPASWFIRMHRWRQRHPRIAIAAVLVFLTLCSWIGALSVWVRRVEAQRNIARAANARLLGVACREKSTAQLTTDPGLALVLAIEADRRDPGFESNMAVLRALMRRHEERTFSLNRPLVACDMDVAGDGQRLLVATSTNQGLIFDLASDGVVESEGADPASTLFDRQCGFSPDRTSFFVTGPPPYARLFDAKTGRLLRSLEGHSEPVTSCEFSPNGSALLTCSLDGYVRLFDVATGVLQRSWGPQREPCTLAQFDSSGSLILTTKNSRPDTEDLGDNDPRVWDARTGAELARLRGHESPIRDARFSVDGAMVFVAGMDGIVRAWDWKASAERWRTVLPDQAWAVAVSSDGALVAVGFETGARVFDARTGIPKFDLVGLSRRSVTELAFSPDGNWIAAIDYGGSIGVWNSVSGAPRLLACAPNTFSGRVAWLPDSKRFVTLGGRERIRMWTIVPVADLVACAPHHGAVTSATFDPASQHVLSAGADGILRVSSVRDGSVTSEIDVGEPLARAWFVGESGRIACLTRSGSLVSFESDDDACRVLHTAYGGTVTCSQLSRTGDSLCFGLDDGRAVWLESSTGMLIAATGPRGRPVDLVAVSRDGRRAAWGAAGGWAGVLERVGGKACEFSEIGRSVYGAQVYALEFTPDGERLITCGDHAGTYVWRAATGELLAESDIRPLGDIAFAHRSSDLFGAAKWVLLTARLEPASLDRRWIQPQPSSDLVITRLRVSPDDRYVLTTSHAGIAQLSSADDGSVVLRFEHGTSPLGCAEFSPDGRAIVTAAADGTVRVWPIDVVGVARAHVASTPEMWPQHMPKGIGDP